MKKILLLSIALLLAASYAGAHDFSAVAPTGQTLYYVINGSAAEVVAPDSGWAGVMPVGALTIPSYVTYGGRAYPVTKIGRYAFSGCSSLTSVVMPNTVTHIGRGAFLFTGLCSVTIPVSVSVIDTNAFMCYTLDHVVYNAANCTFTGQGIFESYFGSGCLTIGDSVRSIPNGIFSYLGGVIDTLCFNARNLSQPSDWSSNGSALGWLYYRELIIGDGVEIIPAGLFCNKNMLTHVEIPASVTCIGDSAFIGCSSLARVSLGSGVDSIGTDAFLNCNLLSRVDYEGSLAGWCNIDFKSISSNPLYNARHLYIEGAETEVETLHLPDSVSRIGNYAFANSTLRGLLDINVRAVGRQAFVGNSYLTRVVLGDDIDSVLDGAFDGCGEVVDLSLGSSLAYVGDRAFASISPSASVTCRADVPPQSGANVFGSRLVDAVLSVPCGSAEAYGGDTCWRVFGRIQSVPMYAFSAVSADPLQGVVNILFRPTCENPEACIRADAYHGYCFDHWSDGSCENPRRLTVDFDTAVAACFVADGTQGIAEVNPASVTVSTAGSCIVVTGAAGEEVRLFDCQGRCLQSLSAASTRCTLQPPASGVYLLQVGARPAQKVVVRK